MGDRTAEEGQAIGGMLHSMTGYGRAEVEDDDIGVHAEIRSLNHRYLDVAVRVQAPFAFLEDMVRREVKSRIARGRVEVTLAVKRLSGAQPSVQVDYARLDAYADAARRVHAQLPAGTPFDLSWIAAVPDLFVEENDALDEERLEALVSTALHRALDALLAMRRREGEALQEELDGHGRALERLVEQLHQLAPLQVEQAGRRLQERLAAYVEPGHAIDPSRLLTEIAILADRLDIEEELHRLASHLEQFARAVGHSSPPVGRRMEFLAQEIHRELNTIGQKAADAHISEKVVAGKVIAERIREQAQNIE